MKKLFCITLVLLIMFSLVSCNEQNEQTELSPTPTQENIVLSDPESVTFVECQFYGDTTENLDWKEIWPAIIEDRFDVELTIINPSRDNYMQTIQASALSGDISGIVELVGGPNVSEWKSQDLIYPLNEFLENNEVWNTVVPDYWKTAYEIDGEIWAIPTGSDESISWLTRSMRGDWLDKLGLSKPTTINEFYEASYMFTYEDPDGNGMNDTVGFTGAGISYLRDIFAAYDARLSHVNRTTLVWNPNTNIWEDSMIKPEMIECLSFLKKCYSEQILDVDCFNDIANAEVRDKIYSGLYGGTSYWDSLIINYEVNMKKVIPDAYMVCVGALTHNITKNIMSYGPLSIGAPRVLMKNTPQPKETINWYVNTFLGDDWGFWTGRLGPVGEYHGQEDRVCSIEEKTIYRNTYIEDGVIKTYPGPGFIGGLPSKALYTVYEVAYYVPNPPTGYETWAEDTADRAMSIMKRRQAWINEYIENETVFLIPSNLMEPSSEEYHMLQQELNTELQNAIKSAIIGDVSIEDAISQYREMAKTLNAKEVLDIENERLGKTTDQDY